METLARRYISRFGDDSSVLEDPPATPEPVKLSPDKKKLRPGMDGSDKTFPWWPAAAAFGGAGVFLGLTAWNWASDSGR